MDKIRIENLEIFAKHGVFPEENFLGQKFVLSAVLHTDTRKAGLTDELSYSVHYGEVSHLIKKVVEENTWKLLETVAEATAKAILLSYPMVSQVDLTIKKPWAPSVCLWIPYRWRSVAAGIPLISRSAPIWGTRKNT